MSESIFGLSEKALELSEKRAVMLSNNIVNSATPNYKARDIDFHGLLQEAAKNNSSQLISTNSKHLQASNQEGLIPEKFRVPMKDNIDGNTVDEEIERKNFMENSINYQMNLTFIKNATDRIMKAIKGE